jgi:threonine dehydrogenase-like Zn-dependent dehydrogenase
MLVRRLGSHVVATDTIPTRMALSSQCGASEVWNPRQDDVVANVKALSDGRGADLVIVAASAPGIVEQAIRASRPGARSSICGVGEADDVALGVGEPDPSPMPPPVPMGDTLSSRL